MMDAALDDIIASKGHARILELGAGRTAYLQHVAARHPPGRVDHHMVADLFALGIQALQHPQRAFVAVQRHRAGAVAPVAQTQTAMPARAVGRRGMDGGGQAACEPRCAQPVVRISIHEKSSYMAMAMAPITTRPANARGKRCCDPAVCMR